MDTPLSNVDIENQCPRAIVLTYPEFLKMGTFNELSRILDTHDIVLCYLTKLNFGHWTCIFKNQDGINFFDPYGYFPDSELRWKSVSPEVKQNHTWLLSLLNDSNVPVHWNEFDLQSKAPNVSTCGRHVIVRLMLSPLNAETYKKVILKTCEKHKSTPDELVVALTSF